jgi:hypothetical protein
MSISKLGCGDGGNWYPVATKEDKPMKTKIEELTGIAQGERFGIKDINGFCYFDSEWELWQNANGTCAVTLDCKWLSAIINDPSLIIRLRATPRSRSR